MQKEVQQIATHQEIENKLENVLDASATNVNIESSNVEWAEDIMRENVKK